MSPAWSSARTTAPTVSGPISWPPSTSSTNSSTTARASVTSFSWPSRVSTLPRRRIVQCRRSRSASRTPSPTPASSAATSLETGSVSSTALSLGKGLDPTMAGMNELERLPEPPSPSLRKPRDRQHEVVLVLAGSVPRLVQELHFGNDDRDAVRRALRQLANVQPDARVPAGDPDPVVGLVQEELALLVVRLPRLGVAAAGRAEEDLVDRKVEMLLGLPAIPASYRLVRVPVRVQRVKRALVMAEDADLQ